MSTPGQGSILGSPIIFGKVDYGPTHGQVYRPLNQKRVVMAAGTDMVQPFDQTVIYKKTVPAAFNVILPDVRLWMTAPYGGFDLMFVDGVGNAATHPITFVPFGTQTIDGATGNLVMNTNNGTLIFVPLIDKTGWTLVEAWPSAGTSQDGIVLVDPTPPDVPSIVYENPDGTFDITPDPTNPNFAITITASSNINNPTVIPGAYYFVYINSTGLGGPGYVTFESPDTATGAGGGVTKVVRGNIVTGGDTILVSASDVHQGDLTAFTAFPLNNTTFTGHYDALLGWIVDRMSSTFTDTTPWTKAPIYGGYAPYVQSINGSTFAVNLGQNYYLCTANTGTFTLPTPIGSGNRYSFQPILGTLITVQLPTATTVDIAGVTSSAAGTLTSSQLGAMITLRDESGAPKRYTVESIVGLWTVT